MTLARRQTDDAREVRYALADPHRLCDALGLLEGPRSYQRQARGLLVRCPWHDENTPSCSVYRGDDGTIAVKCHGCGASGDALALVAVRSGLDPRRDFREVLREGARLAGIRLASLDDAPTSPRPVPLPRPTPAPRDDGPAPLADDVFAELADALLALCPLDVEALAYLEGRGVLPFARHWGALPADRGQLAEVREALTARFGLDVWMSSGLARRDGAWLYAGHRLLIPWRAPGVAGSVLSLQRRTLGAQREGEPKYITTRGRPMRAPYGCEDALEELGEGVELAIVEGAMDVLAMRVLARRAGLQRAAVGIPGVEHWAKCADTLGALARGRVAVVALDADAAGERHVSELADALVKAGATRVVRSRPSTGKDWCDVLQEKSR